MKKIVVIGGGVATKGFLSAALDFHEDIKITVVRRCERAPVPCGIPYAIGTLDSADKNVSPDKNFIAKGVKFIIDEAVDIDLKDNVISLKQGKELAFDKLVIATGAEPVCPPIKGAHLENVMPIYKDVDYVKMIKEKVENAKDIVIVGGGFIGVELADEIIKFEGKNVSIIELARNCLSQAFDEEFCENVESFLIKNGAKIYNKMGAQEFKGENAVKEVVLSNGEIIKSDLVFLNIGAKPDTELAKRAKLDITFRGSIVVDRFMRTSHPDVLAIGDCASKLDFFTGKESGIMLASVAAREGRIAAGNLFDCNFQLEPFGAVSIFSTFIDGVYFGSAGLSEEGAKRYGYRYSVINVEAPDRHPGALPDTKQLKARFVFAQKTGLLVGAQLIGGRQVAEIINIIGFAIQERNTAYQLLGKVYGTHPLATSSPNHYIIHVAARKMVKTLFQGRI